MKDQQPIERIFCNIIMQFDSEQAAKEAQNLLQSSLECTLSKSSCVECRVVMDSTASVKLEYLEQWETEAAFRQHVGSRDFRHVFFAMDMCCEAPDVQIERVTSQSGMDYLRTVYDEGIGLLTERWKQVQ
jgi:quinol monooxygenase YgiN